MQYLLQQQLDTIWIVGSGWEGSFSLEDTVCAGAIADSLLQQTNSSLEESAGNDEVIAAIALYKQWQDQLLDLFYQASHGKRLLRLDCQADLKYCCQTDILDVVPIQKEPGVLVDNSQL